MIRALHPQDHISHFRVVGPLGGGGMGEVYIATDESLDRNVALKILPPRLVRDEDRVRRFVTEAKSASSLNHPNIVTIYEIGKDRVRGSDVGSADDSASEPLHFISMELVAGETLGQKIHEDKADLRSLLGYVAQAAEGVAKAHASGIVHRDLKPGNIMVSRDGFTKVLDFGLAKLTEKPREQETEDRTEAPTRLATTGAGVLVGTVGYMSPEQVQAKDVDHRSDIFSMGCILYEAATKRRPFVAPNHVEVMHQILRERPTPVEETNPEVPADVRRIIRRCLAKNPDQRFQSMKDLAIELREVCDEYEALPISGASATSLSSGALALRPKAGRGAKLGMAVVGLFGAAGLAFGLYGWIFRQAAAGEVGSRAQDLKLSVLTSRDDLSEATLSNDGRYLAFVSSRDDKSTLNVRQVRTGTDVPIVEPQEYQIRGVSFSPDGDYLYYLNQDPDSPAYSALFQVASLGGTPRKILFDIDTAAGFSPDGSRLCFRRGMPHQKADTLIVAELASRRERELVRVKSPESFLSAPAWSPDGKRVAVAMQNIQGGVRSWVLVIDVDSGRQQTVGISSQFTSVNSVGWLPDGGVVVAAFVAGTPAPQVYRLAYPDGAVRKLTNDLSGYGNLSVSASGHSVAAVRRTGVSNVWIAPVDGGGGARAITSATGATGSSKDIAPLPGGAIAFSVAEGDKAHIWRRDADGSAPKQLESQGLYATAPRFGENSGIVYSDFDEQERVNHIWRVDPDGGNGRRLTSGKGETLLSVARDGRKLLFQKWDDPEALWSLDLQGGGEPKHLAADSIDQAAQISSDGRWVCYGTFTMVQDRIYTRQVVIPAEGGPPVAQFLLPPGTTKSGWSADNTSMTYVDRNKGWNLMRQAIAGGEPTPLTRFTEGQTTEFAWSPDGRKLAVVRRVGRAESVWVVEPGGGEPKQVAHFPTGAVSDCRWSLDGKSVVFAYGTSTQDVVLISDVG